MAMPQLTDHQRDLMYMGLCPFCEQPVSDWKPPSGVFSPEAWAVLRDNDIDPVSGHHKTCQYKYIKL